MISSEVLSIVGLALLMLEVIALAAAVHAVMHVRTSPQSVKPAFALKEP